MNENYTQALREVGTLNNIDKPILETLTIWHPSVGGVSLVNDREPFVGHSGSTTTTGLVFYEPSNFSLSLPESSKDGTQFMSVTFSNIEGKGSDFLNKVPVESTNPIEVVHRIYLPYYQSTTPLPQLNPPLRMQILNVEINPFQIVAKATLKSLVNAKYPSYKYNLDDFPALGN